MYTIYLVPHSHYDAVWAFIQDDYTYINELILSKAAELMKSSDYKFQIEQTFLLEEMEERNPRLWSDLAEMIKKKKLEIVDGQYLMPDSMLPDGEVLIREIMVGKRYCKEKFGVDVPVAWAADGFGLNAQLPQIYKKSGYRWLVFRRGAGKKISEFLWKGLDGTKILAHWMPLGYRAGLNLNKLEESFERIKEVAVSSHILMPSGSGVTIPQEETERFVKKWNKNHDDVKVKIATASEFFEALESENIKYRTIRGEMYSGRFSEVFPDVCSSRVWIFLNMRRSEYLMLCAERFATLAWLFGARYPEVMLKNSWKRMLFLAFHDILPGTSIDEVYHPVREYFFALKRDLGKILDDSLDYIANRINTEGESVIVFNPLSWQVTNWVEAEIEINKGVIKNPGLVSEDEIESEFLEIWRYDDGSIKRARIGLIATVPALGYRVYNIVERKKRNKEVSKKWFKIKDSTIDTKFYKLSIDQESGIANIEMKKGDLRIKGNEIVIEDEIGDLYYHQSRLSEPIKTEGGDGLIYGAFKPQSFKIEESPNRIRIRFESGFYTLRWPYRLLHKYKPKIYRHKVVDVCKEIILYRSIPRIDFVTKINNNYPGVRIRVKFDVNIDEFHYYRGTQFGATKETTTDKIHLPKDSVELFSRAPAINWVDYGDDSKGVTLINDGNPENELKTGSIYITLLRSIFCLSADGQSGPLIPTPDALELGEYTFRYALYPHTGSWRDAHSYRHAEQFSRGLIARQVNNDGELPLEYSFLTIEPDNLILSTLKKAEDTEDAILRFYETTGEKTSARIKAYETINKMAEVNLLEEIDENVKPLKLHLLEDGSYAINIKPFEIKTLALRIIPDDKDETKKSSKD
jgi:alpha-mannosidase